MVAACACSAAAVALRISPPYSPVLAPATVAVFVCAAMGCRVWRPGVLGQGAEEFRRLARASFLTLVLLGLGCFAAGTVGTRIWAFTVIPAIAAVMLPTRYVLRRFLHNARGNGRCLHSVLVAGNAGTVVDLIARTREQPHVGWRVDAACVPTGTRPHSVAGVPVLGGLAELPARVRDADYRVVAVTPDPYWTPDRLRRLAWSLEGTNAELVVAPGLMEVAGPRLHVSGVLGMPLLRVSAPAFTGVRRVVKGLVDVLGAALLLVMLSPLLLAVTLAVAVSDGGPVLYRQRRIGKDGAPFTLLKFRTMVTGAEGVPARLVGFNDGAGPLFKLRSDPRVTAVGSRLRRWSIDELPQLVNVLSGRMSLVGPRPPLPEETECYADDVRRRLLVKPGVTGLWQVSGRSDLSWEESVRLDLRYVEDWSLALDALILWKTVRAVVGGTGAY